MGTTKRDLVDRIAEATGTTKVRTDAIIDLFLVELVEVLAAEGRVELRDFGVLRTVDLAARTARNPRTGDPVEVPARTHVRFKAGKATRARLNT
jgi:integration host factor subunit beta